MLTKFFLFVFFTVGYSQVLENKDAVKNDDKDKNLIANISENDKSSPPINPDLDEMQSFIKDMSECCLTSAQSIRELEQNVLKLEKEKEYYVKKINELMETVSNLEKVKSELEQEISESNRWENDLVQYRQELKERERSLGEFRTRLDKEDERQYKLRLDLNKTKKDMYQKFLQLRDQQLQVSQCMNNVTFSEEENERKNAKEKYHLAIEGDKNLLYKCTSISDTGRNYLYKCLPSLSDTFIPDSNMESKESSESSEN